jgi:3-phenylpropionate/cinnamic acid dioxygenase small subunit
MRPVPVDAERRQQLIDVVIRYATAIDQRDWGLFRTCFTEDCRADYGPVGSWSGREELTAFMEQIHAECGVSLHRVGNHVVTAEGEDGYRVRSQVDAVVMRGDNRKGMQTYGHYDDTLVRTGEGWRIAARRFEPSVTVRIVAHPER